MKLIIFASLLAVSLYADYGDISVVDSVQIFDPVDADQACLCQIGTSNYFMVVSEGEESAGDLMTYSVSAGDIVGPIDSIRFSTQFYGSPWICRHGNTNTYILTYLTNAAGAQSNSAYVAYTFSVSSKGIFTNSKIDSTWIFAASQFYGAGAAQIGSSNYFGFGFSSTYNCKVTAKTVSSDGTISVNIDSAVGGAYTLMRYTYGNNIVHDSIFVSVGASTQEDGFIRSFKVSPVNGDVSGILASHEFCTVNTFHPSQPLIYNDDTLVFVFREYGDVFGCTMICNSAGGLTEIDEQALTDGDIGLMPDMCLADASTDLYLMAWRGTGDDGYIKDFYIENGLFNPVGVDSLEHNPNATQYNRIVNINGNFILYYQSNSTDTYIKSFTIDGIEAQLISTGYPHKPYGIDNYQSIYGVDRADIKSIYGVE